VPYDLNEPFTKFDLTVTDEFQPNGAVSETIGRQVTVVIAKCFKTITNTFCDSFRLDESISECLAIEIPDTTKKYVVG
jgi:hypothetical protein